MLIVFGSILVELRFESDTLPQKGEVSIANGYTSEVGGRGANQALAACRTGAKVALVGKVGDDDFGTHILNKLRREGITTSGIGKTKTRTGCSLRIKDNAGDFRHTVAFSANNEAQSEQIPEEILTEQSVMLLQTDMSCQENESILAKSKEAGATTIMNLSPAIEFSQKSLQHLDYLIVNHEEVQTLAEKLGLDPSQGATKIAQALSKAGKLNCIVTLGEEGSIAVTKDGICWKVEALTLEAITDKTGAEDVYCGTFAACIYAGAPIEDAMKRASIAASLTCTKSGGQSTFPFLDDIEEKINDIADAIQA